MMANVDREQVRKVAEFLKANPPKSVGMNFMGPMYPGLDHPQAIDFFFFACLHQYGFWYGDGRGYVEPMIGNVGERKLKGSDLLWTLLKRQLDEYPEFFQPMHLATITPKELMFALTDDEGTQWPDFDVRLRLTRHYGRWLVTGPQTPASIVAVANTYQWPLRKFLKMVSESGYSPFGDDPLQKKQLLLAMALANRPEHFLKVSDPEDWQPIVDYHLMRVALRLGLVRLDPKERSINANRRWVSHHKEIEIRDAVGRAVKGVILVSGLPMSAVDEMLWMARRYCPEMTEPECDKCALASVCAKRANLFQPVFRTTAY